MADADDRELEARLAEEAGRTHAPAELVARTKAAAHAAATDTPAAAEVVPFAPRRRRLATRIAAVLVVVALLFGGGYTAYATETASVEVVGTATVSLGVNRWGTVVSASCDDEAVQRQLDEAGLTGRSYQDALDALLAGEAGEGLSAADVSSVDVCGGDGSQGDELAGQTSESLSASGCSGECLRDGEGSASGNGAASGSGNGNGSGNGHGAAHHAGSDDTDDADAVE